MLFAVLLVAVGIVDAFRPPLSLTTKRYDGYKVLNVVPHNEEALEILHQLEVNDIHIDFWKEPSVIGSDVHLMVSPEELSRVEGILKDAKIAFNTHIEDLQSELTPMWNDIDRRALISGKKAFDLNDYNTLEDVYDWLKNLAGKCRSGLTCQLYSIGNSYEGRPIYVFKFPFKFKFTHLYALFNHGKLIQMHRSINPSRNWYQFADLEMISKPGTGRKGYWVDGTIHAREWLSLATTVNILNNLATGGDANAVRLTDLYDWYILPVMNPDGYKYTWTNDRMWRKNRRPNAGSSCYGTDLNRNFNFRWGTDGVSKLPCSDIYCGSKGGSEPETQAVQNELVRIGKTLAATVTMHAYGNYWMFPWGTTTNGRTCDRAADHNAMQIVADAAKQAIQNTYNTRWTAGNSCEVIYATSGGTDDYAKGVAGVKYTFCPEVRGNTFAPNKSQIPLSFKEIWNGIVAMCDAIKA